METPLARCVDCGAPGTEARPLLSQLRVPQSLKELHGYAACHRCHEHWRTTGTRWQQTTQDTRP